MKIKGVVIFLIIWLVLLLFLPIPYYKDNCICPQAKQAGYKCDCVTTWSFFIFAGCVYKAFNSASPLLCIEFNQPINLGLWFLTTIFLTLLLGSLYKIIVKDN